MSLAAVTLPFRRLEPCPQCEAELHVCKMCRYYDSHVSDQCTEDQAEQVRNKERANFCDYFTPRAGAHTAGRTATSQASKQQLNDLFASSPEGSGSNRDEAGAARDALKDLFKSDR